MSLRSVKAAGAEERKPSIFRADLLEPLLTKCLMLYQLVAMTKPALQTPPAHQVLPIGEMMKTAHVTERVKTAVFLAAPTGLIKPSLAGVVHLTNQPSLTAEKTFQLFGSKAKASSFVVIVFLASRYIFKHSGSLYRLAVNIFGKKNSQSNKQLQQTLEDIHRTLITKKDQVLEVNQSLETLKIDEAETVVSELMSELERILATHGEAALEFPQAIKNLKEAEKSLESTQHRLKKAEEQLTALNEEAKVFTALILEAENTEKELLEQLEACIY